MTDTAMMHSLLDHARARLDSALQEANYLIRHAPIGERAEILRVYVMLQNARIALENNVTPNHHHGV